MSITPDQLKIMIALRDASALRREPRPLTPDGHEKWFTLTQMISEGRLIGPDGFTPPGLSAAARSLRRLGLVAGRVQHTVTWWSLTGGGGAMLARMEADAGVTGLVAAELALEQAQADIEAATDRYQAARAACTAARREAGVRGSVNVLLDALKETAL